jgi:hypothetical protein
MRDEIVEKLRRQLNRPIQDDCDAEARVMYILGQTRKLLDKHLLEGKLSSLKFYCHWALHVDLEFERWTKPFLEVIDQHFIDGFSPQGQGTSPAEAEKQRALFYLDVFRSQFLEFLKAYDLPTDMANNDKWWFGFLTAYAGIIKDGSLVYKGDNLKMVSRASFTMLELPESANARIPFGIRWEIALKDGRTFKVDLNSNWMLLGSIMHELPAPSSP